MPRKVVWRLEEKSPEELKRLEIWLGQIEDYLSGLTQISTYGTDQISRAHKAVGDFRLCLRGIPAYRRRVLVVMLEERHFRWSPLSDRTLARRITRLKKIIAQEEASRLER